MGGTTSRRLFSDANHCSSTRQEKSPWPPKPTADPEVPVTCDVPDLEQPRAAFGVGGVIEDGLVLVFALPVGALVGPVAEAVFVMARCVCVGALLDLQLVVRNHKFELRGTGSR